DIASFDAELSLKIQHIDKNDKFVADDCEQETRQVLILQLESAADDKMEWSFVLSTGLQLCSIKDRAAINYNYIDTARNPVREVGLQEKSVFYQLAKDTIGDELEAISKDVVSYANRKLAESSVLTKYLESIKEMGKLDVIEKYKLLLKNPESSWNNSGYELGTLAGDAELSFDKQSSGIQNLFLLLLMKKKLEGAGIVFIEELEQSLEPKNQRYIAEEYRKLNVGQLFITSHSVDIISRFGYKNIFVVLPTEAKRLFEGQSDSFMKEVTRTNRKDYISSLMANNILLVEGESELGSFPIYSFVNGLSFSYLDIEILRVG
ncbi:MAG: AAA family ATPase, partial [Oscillospiraceae bacterium]|nr:AAA family ATPase [Oscillospiraceae bacterium]